MQKALVKKLITYSFANQGLQKQSAWFKRLLYAYLLLRCVFWLFDYDLLFGEHSVVLTTPRDAGGLKNLAYLIYNTEATLSALYFILALIALCLLRLVYSHLQILADLLIWFLVLNLHNRIYVTLTSGDLLVNQLLFFNCFISGLQENKGTIKSKELRIFFHNLGVLAVILQVCLVYFLSGLAKFNDADWLQGKAVAIILQVEYFRPAFMNSVPVKNNWLLVCINHLVLFYQLLFPALVWCKPIKKAILIVGIGMHLYIILFMGLVWFGSIMLICYIYFWPFKKVES